MEDHVSWYSLQMYSQALTLNCCSIQLCYLVRAGESLLFKKQFAFMTEAEKIGSQICFDEEEIRYSFGLWPQASEVIGAANLP